MRGLTVALGAVLLVGAITLPPPTAAAAEVVVALSPADAVMGEPIEVLVRTFVPYARDIVSLPWPSGSYPVSTGFWNVLYPIPDYPFDIVATAVDGTNIAVAVARDPNDVTLWRGTFAPTTTGTWVVWVRNWPVDQRGASAALTVRAAPVGAFGPLAAVAAVFVLLVGFALGRRFGARSPRLTSSGPAGTS